MSAPEEMPVNETIELADRLRTETDVDLAAVVVNRVLPELFGRGEEEVFDRAAHQPRTPASLTGARRRRRPARCSTPPSWPSPCAAPAPTTSPACAELPPDLPLLYVPYLFTRDHGVRATRPVAERSRAELGY